jgi:hypothetical protein
VDLPWDPDEAVWQMVTRSACRTQDHRARQIPAPSSPPENPMPPRRLKHDEFRAPRSLKSLGHERLERLMTGTLDTCSHGSMRGSLRWRLSDWPRCVGKRLASVRRLWLGNEPEPAGGGAVAAARQSGQCFRSAIPGFVHAPSLRKQRRRRCGRSRLPPAKGQRSTGHRSVVGARAASVAARRGQAGAAARRCWVTV